ncbi:MAG: glycerophosphoryl diester phosphodiesterase membrane domain-containing protein [bacterium]|nr:glycerophosphoryl diester phosphodiesterase membrane domain-containing protein [bacterium]
MKPIPTYSILLRLAWRQYLNLFEVVLLANLVVAIPVYLLVDWTTPRELFKSQLSSLNEVFALVMEPAYLLNLGIQLVGEIVIIYAAVAILITMKHAYFNKKATIKHLLSEALPFYPKAMVVVLITNIIVLIGYGLFFIPGIIFSIMFAFVLPILVWENATPLQAMKKSWKVVRENWWTVFSYLVLTQLIVGAISLLIITSLPDVFGFVALGMVISVVFSSFTTVFTMLLYTLLQKPSHKKESHKSDPKKSTPDVV